MEDVDPCSRCQSLRPRLDSICMRLEPLHADGLERMQVELVHAAQTASRQYCHRQLTWARGLPLFSWVDADQGQEAAVAHILAELQNPKHTGAQKFSSHTVAD